MHEDSGDPPVPAERSRDSAAVTKRCLVVGGGLIGSHLACELTRCGSEVVLLSRSVSPWLERNPEAKRIRIVRGEIGHSRLSPEWPDDLDSLVAASDFVFMMAGRSTPAMSDSDAVGSIVESLVPTLTLLESARRTGTRRIVIATSGGTVYGQGAVVPTPETHTTEPISVHGINSVAIESYTSFFNRAYGLTATILRYSNVYGPGQGERGGFAVIAAWLRAALEGSPAKMMGGGKIRRDFVFAPDAARAAILASRLDSGGTFNVGSGRATSLIELRRAIERVTGGALLVEQLESRPIDVAVTCLDTRRLQRLTGWRPATGLDEGLRLTWEWIVSAHHESAAAA